MLFLSTVSDVTAKHVLPWFRSQPLLAWPRPIVRRKA